MIRLAIIILRRSIVIRLIPNYLCKMLTFSEVQIGDLSTWSSFFNAAKKHFPEFSGIFISVNCCSMLNSGFQQLFLRVSRKRYRALYVTGMFSTINIKSIHDRIPFFVEIKIDVGCCLFESPASRTVYIK